MRWENNTQDWPMLSDPEIPAELLDGLERYSADGVLLKARLRWRPHQTAATGFLTKDRLLELRGQPVLEVARALASLAHQLHEQGGCEPKFEAQIQREHESDDPEGGLAREWRSITFYVNRPQPEPTFASQAVHDDDPYESPTDRYPSAWTPPPRGRAPSLQDFVSEYSSFIDLSRTDPTGFAMLALQYSSERTIGVLEGLLGTTASRLDRVFNTQMSSNRHVNDSLQILTQGAAEVARVGVSLFNKGLEGQSRFAQMQHESELGKERTELMRDAVKHGSLLVQAVLMSNQAKQQQRSAQPATPGVTPPPPSNTGAVPGQPPPMTPPFAAHPTSPTVDDEIEVKTRRLLELVTDDVLEKLRAVGPSLAGVFDALRAEPITADRVRRVIREAQTTVDPVELGLASKQFGPEVAHSFGVLVMRVLSEDPA